jgi:MYXO-CTERM domain-containing protein
VNAGQNVRLTRCSFAGVAVPEPSPSPLLGLALLVLLPWLRRAPTAA